MAIAIPATKNTLATSYGTNAPYGVLFAGVPASDGTATNEINDGTTTRKALSWGAPSSGAITSAATVFNVAAGKTVDHFGVAKSVTGGTADIADWVAVTSQAFSSAGTYTVTATYTQT